MIRHDISRMGPVPIKFTKITDDRLYFTWNTGFELYAASSCRKTGEVDPPELEKLMS